MTDKIPTIVVVDDSKTSRAVYEHSVKSLAVNLICFDSSTKAFEYLQAHQPDLLLLDILMPGMDGLSLLRELRKLPHEKETPVIMVTSKDYAQDRYISKQLKAKEFIIKPIRFQEIRDLICKHVAIKSQS
jgi:CheY-like chemotaxis protein